MDEHDIEQLLVRYRPAAPSPDLRARILRATPVRLWPWAAAAAAVVIAALGFNAGSRRLVADAGVTPGHDLREAAIQDLAAILGGDETARRFAEAEVHGRRDAAPAALAPSFEGDLQ